MMQHPPALFLCHHVNTVYIIAVMTSLNCGVDMLCFRSVEPDSSGHARTYDTEDASVAARERLNPQHAAVRESTLKCVRTGASALPYVKND
jgi:hypothetical protein